ncbi:hypothetical protein MC885_003759 [Smutsia gigantea]|nr:hypothetical protein MC885_003759 [Smutsia gigantea]
MPEPPRISCLKEMQELSPFPSRHFGDKDTRWTQPKSGQPPLNLGLTPTCLARPCWGGLSQPLASSGQTRTVQAAMIQDERLNTSSTVPGQMVISVFMTKRVLKVILLSAPMLRLEASVKILLCSSMTRPSR